MFAPRCESRARRARASLTRACARHARTGLALRGVFPRHAAITIATCVDGAKPPAARPRARTRHTENDAARAALRARDPRACPSDKRHTPPHHTPLADTYRGDTHTRPSASPSCASPSVQPYARSTSPADPYGSLRRGPAPPRPPRPLRRECSRGVQPRRGRPRAPVCGAWPGPPCTPADSQHDAARTRRPA